MTKYDDASWHFGASDFPRGLPEVAGAVNGGMFFVWLVINGHASSEHYESFPEETRRLKDRQISPAAYYLLVLDGKLVDEDLTEVGKAFTEAYFSILTSDGQYNGDYLDLLEPDEGWVETAADECCPYIYGDTWENFDLLAGKIAERFSKW